MNEVKEIESQFASGLLTQGEKYNKIIDIWMNAKDLVSDATMEGISKETVVNSEGEEDHTRFVTTLFT